MKTAITELLGIEYPVIQGGMAWVAESHLASAVSNAGGLGTDRRSGGSGRVGKRPDPSGEKNDRQTFGVNIMLMVRRRRCSEGCN